MTDWESLWQKPEPPPRAVGTRSFDADTDNAYAAAALRNECLSVTAAANGTRNHTLNAAAFSLGQIVAAGGLTEADVRAALTNAARAVGLDENEIGPTISSGLRSGGQHPRLIPEQPTAVTEVPIADLSPEESDAFWDARPLLRHLHDFARARRVSPWAVLGVTLARVVTAVPYHVVLPPIVGPVASLNLFIGLVGTSGTGKGAAEGVAADAYHVGLIETHKTGSGEGIAHGYMKRQNGEVVQHTHAVLFSVPEIDTLTALGGRQGATLMPELRSGWSGERLGFGYADPAKRLPVPAHQYRMCLVAGIQPHRAQTLLDDADGGTPQRFVWLPAADPGAPDQPPPCPDPHTWPGLDTRPGRGSAYDGHGRLLIQVCDTARATIDQARLERLRGDGEALDGHGLLCRLKVAAALACADSRLEVNLDDWELAGVVQHKSDATRTHVQASLASAVKERNDARGQAEAQRALVVHDSLEDAAVKRVCKAIVRKLKREGGWTARHEVRKAVTSRDRGYFDEALERLFEAGQIESEDSTNGAKYRPTEAAS